MWFLRMLSAVALLAGGCDTLAPRDGVAERQVSGVGTVRVPSRLDVRPNPINTWYGTSLHLTRPNNSFGAMGSNSPQHENLLVTQLHPVLVHQRGIKLLDEISDVFEYTKDVRWEPYAARGSYQFRYGTGRYTPNTMNEPAVLAQGFDVARGLAVSYRGLTSDIQRPEVEALLDAVMASYTPMVDLPTWFSAVERDLGAGVTIALPIELTDPYSWNNDPSGVNWMYFHRHREWAEAPDVPEQTTLVAAFFAPGDAAQAAVAASIVEREVGAEREPSWLAQKTDAARGIAVAARAWKRNITEAGVAQLVDRTIASYRFTGEATFFRPRTP